ncbi:DUF1853 family protein [Marinobacterium marinum]|uniref:DUF1853 family protein n=1 Tax=Marinobacterium marinum TaxID=2756129 RepID=A0A7W2AAB8_9GAMM|nr:DUF1853 family protein [Marinobacterium marinum]MBA4501731.1 DUF1853 family protein [Marinobacterium marinum]
MSASADPDEFKQPAIRHLAWLCRAPQLYRGAPTFVPRDWLPPDYRQQLHHWDHAPETLPELLQGAPARRLGHYFEQLYACLLSDLLGWPLLARNLPIRDSCRTLGELDFLVRNLRLNRVEHHEIAVKFYLGHRSAESGLVRWYGPDSRDRLDIKTERLLTHQTRLTALPDTRAAMRALGIQTPPVPFLYMPGYLFQPLREDLPVPEQVDSDYASGRWCYPHEVDSLEPEGWVSLHKPHWLGPWCQTVAPETGRLQQAAAEVASTGRACLLGRLVRGITGWVETERLFIVSNDWPTTPSKDSRGRVKSAALIEQSQ